jgi:hypothetical protein
VDSTQCQEGAKELAYQPTVLEKRMVNFNSLTNNATHLQKYFTGKTLLLEKSINRCYVLLNTRIHAAADRHVCHIDNVAKGMYSTYYLVNILGKSFI